MSRNFNFAGRPLMAMWSILLLVSAVYAAEDAEVDMRCPTNMAYTSKMAVFRDTCYQFVRTEKFWEEARDMCWAWGGKLIEIEDAATNNFIKTTLNELSVWSNKGIWIGLHDQQMELVWRWIGTKEEHYSGVSPSQPRFAFWEGSHPGTWFHSMKDCVRMDRDSQWRWKETPCSGLKWHYRFICQYPAAPLPSEPQPPGVYGRHHLSPPPSSSSSSSSPPPSPSSSPSPPPSPSSTAARAGELWNHRKENLLKMQNRQLGKIPSDAMNQKGEAPIYVEEGSSSKGTLMVICIIVVILVVCLIVLALLMVRSRRLHGKPLSEALFVVEPCTDKFNNPLYGGDGPPGLAQCLLNQPRETPQAQSKAPHENLYVSPEEMAGTGVVKEDTYLAPVDERGLQRPLPKCPIDDSQTDHKPVCSYLPMDAASHRGSTDTLEMGLDDVEEEMPGFAYDTPKASHVYAEIPCDEANVYEALDDVNH